MQLPEQLKWLYDFAETHEDHKDVDIIAYSFRELVRLQYSSDADEDYMLNAESCIVANICNHSFSIDTYAKMQAFTKYTMAFTRITTGEQYSNEISAYKRKHANTETRQYRTITEYAELALQNAVFGLSTSDLLSRIISMGYQATSSSRVLLHRHLKKRPDLFVQPKWGHWMLTRHYYTDDLSREESAQTPGRHDVHDEQTVSVGRR